MRTAEFDPERLEANAAQGWTTLTELADTLVRDRGVSFRMAHAISGRLIGARQRDTERPLSALLAEVSAGLLGTPIAYSEAALAEILSARHFVNVRRTFGGPAPEETRRASNVSRAQLEADQTWWIHTTDALSAAERRLAERASSL
jgi:argininosuccinate lyase